jgi:hypothetical protein
VPSRIVRCGRPARGCGVRLCGWRRCPGTPVSNPRLKPLREPSAGTDHGTRGRSLPCENSCGVREPGTGYMRLIFPENLTSYFGLLGWWCSAMAISGMAATGSGGATCLPEERMRSIGWPR